MPADASSRLAMVRALVSFTPGQLRRGPPMPAVAVVESATVPAFRMDRSVGTATGPVPSRWPPDNFPSGGPRLAADPRAPLGGAVDSVPGIEPAGPGSAGLGERRGASAGGHYRRRPSLAISWR